MRNKRSLSGSRYGKCLFLGIVIVLCYCMALYFYERIQLNISVEMLLSDVFPDEIMAEQILKSIEKSDEEIRLCFYRDDGLHRLQEPEYGRNCQVMAEELQGDSFLYDRRITGFLSSDKDGCVLDEKSAEQLFGTKSAEGRSLICGGKCYQVRKVLPWKQQKILIHPDGKGDRYDRVFITGESEKTGKTPEQLLLSYGLSGIEIKKEFVKVIPGFLLRLFPAVVFWELLKHARRERKMCYGGWRGYLGWTAGMSLAVVAIAAVLFSDFRISKEWIPARWSDFSFWSERFAEVERSFLLLFGASRTAPQVDNILFCIKSIVFSLCACFLFIVIHEKMCYTICSMYFSGKKKKENAVWEKSLL